MRQSLGTVVVLAAISATLFVVASAASANVMFDAGTGSGFVGPRDVRLAFGWDAAALRRNAADVTFTYDVTDSYLATCAWVTVQGVRGEHSHHVERTTTTAITSHLTYQARDRRQPTGFVLLGFRTTTEARGVPVVGDPCPAGAGHDGHEGAWTSVSLLDSTGRLHVTHDGISVLLRPTV